MQHSGGRGSTIAVRQDRGLDTGEASSSLSRTASLGAPCGREGPRSRARYGHRGVRIGQASHPGPAEDTSDAGVPTVNGPELPPATRRRLNAGSVDILGACADTIPASDGAVAAFHARIADSRIDVLPASGNVAVGPVPMGCPPAQRLQCPMCRPFSTSGELRMLLAHVATAHSGEAIGPEARAKFSVFGRGLCTTEGCGALRAFGVPRCRKCRRNVPVRALAEGDKVPSNSSRPEALSQAESVPPPPPSEPPRVEPAAPRFGHELPPDFLARVRRLPTQTQLRVPAQFRENLCTVTAECVEGCNAGDMSSAILESPGR